MILVIQSNKKKDLLFIEKCYINLKIILFNFGILPFKTSKIPHLSQKITEYTKKKHIFNQVDMDGLTILWSTPWSTHTDTQSPYRPQWRCRFEKHFLGLGCAYGFAWFLWTQRASENSLKKCSKFVWDLYLKPIANIGRKDKKIFSC